MNRLTHAVVYLFVASALLVSCNNARLRPAKAKTTAVVANSTLPTILDANISNNVTAFITMAQMGTGQTSNESLYNYCAVGSGSGTGTSPGERACGCAYEWSTVNAMGGTASTVMIPRSAVMPLTNVNLYSAECALPSMTGVEQGTSIKIKLVGQGAQNNTFQTNAVTKIYQPASQGASCTSSSENCVVDQTGISYFNAIRYACFEFFVRDTAFRNQRVKLSTDDGDLLLPVANKFCFPGKAQVTGNTTLENCAISQPTYTGQSNYYNLLARSNSFNWTQSNENYFCPTVKPSDTIATATSQQFPGYPGTPAFMLAPTWSTENPIGIEAPTTLGDSNPTNNRTFCKKADGSAGPPSVGSQNNEIATGCVGYVSAVNTSGDCSPKMVNGVLRNQYRLRRYIAKLPTIFEASGHVNKNARIYVDQFYSLDRPVGNNPVDGFSMLGPKPCPQAYFDRKAVTGLRAQNSDSPILPPNYPVQPAAYTWNASRPYRPGYVATNSGNWTDRSVDGIRFPNRDVNFLANEPVSCAAALPLYSTSGNDREVISIFTSHASNPEWVDLGLGRRRKLDEIHVRPLDPFVPEYVEDPRFRACALEPENGFKSPMHFANVQVENQTQTAYCEEIYPTQNDNVAKLDAPVFPVPNPAPTFTASSHPGSVKVYTSHVVKPSSLSNISSCDATPLVLPSSGAYLNTTIVGPGLGTYLANLHHQNTIVDFNGMINVGANKTCDRTVETPPGSILQNNFWYFPLLAESLDVESALRSHSQYRCTITKDNGDGRAGVDTPSGGCSSLVPKTTSNAHTEPHITIGSGANTRPGHVHLPPAY